MEATRSVPRIDGFHGTPPAPGSTAELRAIAERISRLVGSQQVVSALPQMDIEQLAQCAASAVETLAAFPGATPASPPAESTLPALCALAEECIKVVEKAELSTYLAHLVSAGCEVLAALLDPTTQESRAAWGFDWLNNSLEDLSDLIDFLALEIYCGLGRLESAAAESDALPVVLDPAEDSFGNYWGSLEHRLALQELSAWLLCVVFRTFGYGAVTARLLMEFANHDLLCLCALLRGLLAVRPGYDEGLPRDAWELQRVALSGLCGLTAPELAFPQTGNPEEEDDDDYGDDGIIQQNRVLGFYLEVLCAAVVETGLLEEALNCALLRARLGGEADVGTAGMQFISFLATLTLQAEAAEQLSPPEPAHPALRLRAEVARRADGLGMLLEAGLATHMSSASRLKETALASGSLCAALAALGSQEDDEDGFTLACRGFLSACLERGVPQGREAAATVAALAALAMNVGDWGASRMRLAELAAPLSAEECQRACKRLSRSDCMRVPVRSTAEGGREQVLQLFARSEPTPRPARAEERAAAPPPAPAAVLPKGGLRDTVVNAPQELRCALDQKLLCDPVVSPGGVAFERSILMRWLQTHGPQCPVTGLPLTFEQCHRSPELRRKVSEWVRGEARARKPARQRAG